MRLLLDTHIWIWALLRPDKISREVRRQLDNPRNELYLSPVSIWEAHHLHRRGKFRLKKTFTEWIDQAFREVPVLEAPFNFTVASETSRIHLPQPDPGDLLLAATASVLDLTLVTNDSQFIECGWLKVLVNS
ncbi:MAG: type II toxin-antitoxin system VapC family toxin [Bryobacterales bacterium]|nr:type II toxin-antitoxin system VapC family toxin [Bryobacterales bacterium]MBV9400885.1 type II toxin-antitoxin system VapC family toxin [Bryobacterales bacterium]